MWYRAIPVDQRGGSFGQEYGNLQAAGEGGEAGDVVAVLVGDEDGVDAGRVFADGCEAEQGLLPAEAGVDEDAGILRPDKDGVARARTGQNTNLENVAVSLISF